MSGDRIDRAHQLRIGIWEWSRANPHALMDEFFAAFPHIKTETIRKAIIRLRGEGVIAMTGARGRLGRYTCTGLLPRSVAEARARLRTSQKREQSKAAKTCKRWTAEEDAALRDKYQAATIQQIAAMLGRTAHSVKCRAHQLGVAKAREAEPKARASVTVTCGAVTTHRGTHRDRPLPHQRGQGAVAGRATINCQQNY